MVTEWNDFMILRGVHVEEGPGINHLDAILAVINRRDHIISNLGEDGLEHKPETYPRSWKRDKNDRYTTIYSRPCDIHLAKIPDATAPRGITIRIPVDEQSMVATRKSHYPPACQTRTMILMIT